eukprot:4913341-Alexandrium_andersonii.AAC.1
MMTQCPDPYPVEQGESSQPCRKADCVLGHDARRCCGERGAAGVDQPYRRRGVSVAPSALCHLVNPRTERNAALTSEG